MSILQSIVLGIIQGISEFLPISSSGHLVLFPYFFGWDYTPLYFTVTVHFATLLAVVSVFYRDIYRIIKGLVLAVFIREKRNSSDFKLGIFIIIGSIPAAAIGFFLVDFVESLFSKPLLVAVFLLLTAAILWTGETVGRKKEQNVETVVKLQQGTDTKTGLNYLTAFIVGAGQALAIFPGISRAGSTISFARIFGIKRAEAVRFSFLLAIPVILGSFVFELYNSYDIIFSGDPGQAWVLIAGFVSAYIAGFGAIRFLVRLVRSRNLNAFAIYCICLAAAAFIFYIIEKVI